VHWLLSVAAKKHPLIGICLFLLNQHLRDLGWNSYRIRNAVSLIRGLYDLRIIADYKSGLTVDKDESLKARRDAHAFCRLLGVIN